MNDALYGHLGDLLTRRTGTCPPPFVNAEQFHRAFSSSARQASGPFASDELTLLAIDWPAARTLTELWRITLLVGASDASDFESLVTSCYRKGDNGERIALLRALPLLPQAERFLPIALDACRSHVVPIFEAIACDNPYPSRFFPELHFNQMAIRTLFLDIRLDRVADLARRCTPELERMARDFVSERIAAGRKVPTEIQLLTREA